MDVLRVAPSPVSGLIAGAVRLQRRVSARLGCTPLPRWIAVGFVVFAVTALFSDLAGNRLAWPLTFAAVPIVIEMLLSYGALAVIGFRPLAGVLLSVAALGFSLSSGGLALPLFIASVVTIVVAAHCSRVQVIAYVAVCLAWGLVAALGRSSVEADLLVLWTVVLVVLPSLAVGLGIRLGAARLAQQNAKVRELETLNARIRQEERAALARELHDVVAHELTVITMQVMGRRASRDPDELQEVLSIVDSSARSALTELRKMLVLLRDEGWVTISPEQSVEHPDLEFVLEDLAEELISLGYPTTWTYDEDGPEKLTPTLLRTCSRILQESVTNIIKHARKGSPCQLSGEVRAGRIHLRVSNELASGARRNEAGSSSLGLVGLGERVDLLHGNIRAGVRGDLWVVDVDIPINP